MRANTEAALACRGWYGGPGELDPNVSKDVLVHFHAQLLAFLDSAVSEGELTVLVDMIAYPIGTPVP